MSRRRWDYIKPETLKFAEQLESVQPSKSKTPNRHSGQHAGAAGRTYQTETPPKLQTHAEGADGAVRALFHRRLCSPCVRRCLPALLLLLLLLSYSSSLLPTQRQLLLHIHLDVDTSLQSCDAERRRGRAGREARWRQAAHNQGAR